MHHNGIIGCSDKRDFAGFCIIAEALTGIVVNQIPVGLFSIQRIIGHAIIDDIGNVECIPTTINPTVAAFRHFGNLILICIQLIVMSDLDQNRLLGRIHKVEYNLGLHPREDYSVFFEFFSSLVFGMICIFPALKFVQVIGIPFLIGIRDDFFIIPASNINSVSAVNDKAFLFVFDHEGYGHLINPLGKYSSRITSICLCQIKRGLAIFICKPAAESCTFRGFRISDEILFNLPPRNCFKNRMRRSFALTDTKRIPIPFFIFDTDEI